MQTHTFPSGLTIDYDSNLEADYCADRNAVMNQEDLLALQQKWSPLLPEIRNTQLKAETFVALRSSEAMQQDFVHRAASDPLCHAYINLLVPTSLLEWSFRAQEYGVSTGVVILQLWHGGRFRQTTDGTWVPLRS